MTVGIKIGVEVDKSKLREIAPELKRAFSGLNDILKDFGGAPGMGGVAGAIFGGGDKKQGRAALGDAARFIRDQHRTIAAENRSETRKLLFDLEKDREKKMAAVGFGKFGAADRRAIQDWYREQRRAVKEEAGRAADDLSRERGRVAGWTGTLGGAMRGGGPGGPGGPGGGPNIIGSAGGFGAGLLRSVSGGMLFGGVTAGYLGYLAGRQLLRSTGRDTERYNLARRMGTFGELTGGNDKFESFVQRTRIPLLNDEDSLRSQGMFLSQAGTMGGRGGGMARSAATTGIGFGVGPEEGAMFFGNMAKLGMSSDEKSQRKNALLIGEAVVNAQMRGREGEMFQSIMEFVQMGMRSMVKAPGLTDVLSLQTRLASTGGAEMRGEAGMRVLGAAHSAMASTDMFPGLGAGLMQPMMMSAMIRGGVRDPFQMQEIAQQGMFGQVGGQPMFKRVLDEMRRSGLGRNGAGRLIMARNMGFGSNVGLFRNFEGMADSGEMGGLLNELPSGILDKFSGNEQRMGALWSAMEKRKGGGSKADFIAEATTAAGFKPGAETRQEAGATASQKLDDAFRGLVPVIDTVAAAFLRLAGNMSGGEMVAGAGVLGGAAWLGKRALGRMAGRAALAAGGAAVGTTAALALGTGFAAYEITKHTGLAQGIANMVAPVGTGADPGRSTGGMGGAMAKLPYHAQQAVIDAAMKNGVDPQYLASIWLAEGGDKASLGGSSAAFGIADDVSMKWRGNTSIGAKADIAGATTRSNMTRYMGQTGKSPMGEDGKFTSDFISFMGSSYAPANDPRDTNKLNANWPGNVSREYAGVNVTFQPALIRVETKDAAQTYKLVPQANTVGR